MARARVRIEPLILEIWGWFDVSFFFNRHRLCQVSLLFLLLGQLHCFLRGAKQLPRDPIDKLLSTFHGTTIDRTELIRLPNYIGSGLFLRHFDVHPWFRTFKFKPCFVIQKTEAPGLSTVELKRFLFINANMYSEKFSLGFFASSAKTDFEIGICCT